MARSNNDLQQVAVLNLTGWEARYALIGLAFAGGMLAAAYSLYPRHFAIQGPLLLREALVLTALAGGMGLIKHLLAKLTGAKHKGGNPPLYTRGGLAAAELIPTLGTGLAVLLANLLAPPTLFWTFYMLQVANLSSAVGNIHTAYRVMRLPGQVRIGRTRQGLVLYQPASEGNLQEL